MEGGKKMKSRVIFKSIFVIVLLVILLCLVFIIYDKAGKRARIYDPLLLSTYTIFYDNEGSPCMSNPEVIYKDSKYTYSLPCISSYDTYLLWDDGTKELVKNALENKKVDINSLIDHGLKIDKNEI